MPIPCCYSFVMFRLIERRRLLSISMDCGCLNAAAMIIKKTELRCLRRNYAIFWAIGALESWVQAVKGEAEKCLEHFVIF